MKKQMNYLKSYCSWSKITRRSKKMLGKNAGIFQKVVVVSRVMSERSWRCWGWVTVRKWWYWRYLVIWFPTGVLGFPGHGFDLSEASVLHYHEFKSKNVFSARKIRWGWDGNALQLHVFLSRNISCCWTAGSFLCLTNKLPFHEFLHFKQSAQHNLMIYLSRLWKVIL